MKRTLLPLVATGLALFAYASFAEPPFDSSQSTGARWEINNGASGNVCYLGPDNEFRCRTFSVWETSDTTGKFPLTRVRVTLMRNGPMVSAYRWFECPVDPHSLKVSPTHASFSATIDTDSSACTRYGYECANGECREWLFTGTFLLEADLLSPAYSRTEISVQSEQNDRTGEATRRHCHGGRAGELAAGGVAFNSLYFPFGNPGEYGQATGEYLYWDCKANEQ